MENANNFNEIQKNIHLYLDEAQSEEEQLWMMEQVKNDPGFPQMINRERNFRTFLKNNVRRPLVSNTLIRSIIKRVKTD